MSCLDGVRPFGGGTVRPYKSPPTMNRQQTLDLGDALQSQGPRSTVQVLAEDGSGLSPAIAIATPHRLILRIYGSDGVEIREGDLVATTTNSRGGWRGGFFTRVKVHQGGIYPFSHFSYAHIIKVGALPEGMLPMSRDKEDPIYNGLPEAWYDPNASYLLEDEDQEENVRNWKRESMAFEGRGFYRVELDNTTSQ